VIELAAAWTYAHAIADRAEAQPLRWMRWLPVQHKYLGSVERFRLLRAGNQALGKTTVALADLALHALGEHPYRPCGEAGEYWVICASWSQSIAIQAKLHALLPAARLHPDTVYTSARGFRGKNPAVEVQHAGGGYSMIRFRTTQQGTLNLAGATIHGALFDEPPASEAVYAEVVKRVLSTGGWVSIAMTPIGAPIQWIREAASDGRIWDLHQPLTPEALIPIGSSRPRRLGDGTVCDQAWIAQIEAQTPSYEIPVRVHGEWEVRTTDRYFDVFRSSGDRAHVHTHAPGGDVKLSLGIDHGSQPGKQIAVLVAVTESSAYPRIYVVDHYVDTSGAATPEDDAAGILAMLHRHGLKWRDLSFVYGDIVHMKGSVRQKSNADLARHLCRRLGLAPDTLWPQIRTVKQGRANQRGAIRIASRWLYHQAVRDEGIGVHPRCTRLIEAIDRYHPDRDDDYKDPVDALRYALDPWIWRQPSRPTATIQVQ